MRPIYMSTGKCDDSSSHRNNEYIIHTFKYVPESFFRSQQIGLGLEKGTYFVAQKFFFLGGGGWVYGNFVGCP